MNGQRERRRIVRDLARAADFDVVLETGTFRGTTTEYLYAVFGSPVHTAEADERYFTYSRRRLSPLRDVSSHLADSRDFLRQFAEGSDARTAPFIYLDAHWHEDLPLAEELDVIARSWRRAVVMVDDFEVPGDPGYQFPDYGPGKRLSTEILPSRAMQDWVLAFPASRSEQETGAKMGCCVLFGPEAPVDAHDVESLRVAEDWPPAP